jgi:hypothetical protein
MPHGIGLGKQIRYRQLRVMLPTIAMPLGYGKPDARLEVN